MRCKVKALRASVMGSWEPTEARSEPTGRRDTAVADENMASLALFFPMPLSNEIDSPTAWGGLGPGKLENEPCAGPLEPRMAICVLSQCVGRMKEDEEAALLLCIPLLM